MKWLIRLTVRLYPASWRHHYRTEFDALLEDIKPRGRDFLDVFAGALKMHMTTGTLGKHVTVFGLAGALLAAALSFTLQDKYISVAVVTMQNAAGQTGALKANRTELEQLVHRVLDRDSLTGITENQHLYEHERADTPESVLDRMRSDITIRLKSPTALEVSFAYPEAARAQNVTSDLLGKLIDENARPKTNSSTSAIFRVNAPPSMPLPFWPNRRVLTSLGFGAGLLMGLAVAWVRRPKINEQF
jgi:hypothetical protein